MRWEEDRRKARRLMDQDDNYLTGKAKAAHTSKGKRLIHSLHPIGRQLSSHFLGSSTSVSITVVWENKYYNHACSPFLLLSLRFYC